MDKAGLIIFDMDGTLFRTETVDVEAFNKALAVNGYETLSQERILGLIGMTLDEICKGLLKTKDERLINKFKADLIDFEARAIAESGQLYPGVEELLAKLGNKGFTLCICSNGNKEYISSICQKFGFDRYFSDIWFEHKGITKSQAVGLLKQKHQVHSFIMVGDRNSDIQAARDNCGISVGAAYGFGGKETEAADYKANNIQQVYDMIMSASGLKQ